MERVALYPGSFNAWHAGHEDILQKSLKVFDKVIVLQGHNPKKVDERKDKKFLLVANRYNNVECGFFTGLLADCVKDMQICAIIRGLRNGYDLEYEINQQYWNEDLGVNIPFVYFITDRKYGHISSSAIRELELFRNKGKK